MVGSRKRSATSPPTVNLGPVWVVSTLTAERHVAAPTAEAAIAVFHKTVIDANSDDDKVREVKLVAMNVLAEPGLRPQKTDGH